MADGSVVPKCFYIQLDIAYKAAVEKVITEFHSDAIIHCAAWTAVDAIENEENQERLIKETILEHSL